MARSDEELVAATLAHGLEPLELSWEQAAPGRLVVRGKALPGGSIAVALGEEALRTAVAAHEALAPASFPARLAPFLASGGELRIAPDRDRIGVSCPTPDQAPGAPPRLVALYGRGAGWSFFADSLAGEMPRCLRWLLLLACLDPAHILLLHASLVRYRGAVLLLIGRRQAGKTATAVELWARGGEILAEDAVFLSRRGTFLPLFPSGSAVVRVRRSRHEALTPLWKVVAEHVEHCRWIAGEEDPRYEVPVELLGATSLGATQNGFDRVVLLAAPRQRLSAARWPSQLAGELWLAELRLPELVFHQPERFLEQRNLGRWAAAEWRRREVLWQQVLTNRPLYISRRAATASARVDAVDAWLGTPPRTGAGDAEAEGRAASR